MSGIQRYTLEISPDQASMVEFEDGRFVLFADHEAENLRLHAEVERLKGEIGRLHKLLEERSAENLERARLASVARDAMGAAK